MTQIFIEIRSYQVWIITYPLPCLSFFNSIPNNKILDPSKLKAFADEKFKVMKFILERVENVGKGENAGYQHFLLFPQCFLKPYSLWFSKFRIVW